MQLAELLTPVPTGTTEMSMAPKAPLCSWCWGSAVPRPKDGLRHCPSPWAAGLSHSTACQALKTEEKNTRNVSKCLSSHLGQHDTLGACGPRLSPVPASKPTQKSCADQPRQSQLHPAEASFPTELSETHLNSQGKLGGNQECVRVETAVLCCPAVRRKAFFLSLTVMSVCGAGV